MNLVQKPEPISLDGNIPEFIFKNCTAPVRFILECAGTQIVNEYLYPDENKKASVDVSAVIIQMLRLSLPPFSDTIHIQTNAVKKITAKIEGIEPYHFTVVRGGVDNLRQTAAEFLKYNFLTWQPQVKEIYLRQPEFLSYYVAETSTLNIIAYFADKTTATHTVSLPTGEVVTCNMNYDIVNSYFAPQVSYYDVFVTNSAGERNTYIQRYLPVTEPERAEIYLFHNTLSGIDTLVCTGTLTQSNETKTVLSRINGETTDNDVDFSVSYEQNTGILKSSEQALWLRDFFVSDCRYHFTDIFRKIYIEESDNKFIEFEINSYTFEYCYSKQKIYNNVPRNRAALPALLEFPTQDTLFFLTPRLSEYPVAAYGDDLMIPVQNPYSGAWQRIAAGELGGGTGGGGGNNYWSKTELTNEEQYLCILQEKIKAGFADNAEKWSGHKFTDFLDQPLRKSDNVEFKTLKTEQLTVSEIQTPEFVSGFGGSGTRLKDDHLELDQITIRKQMTVRELMIEKVSAVGGTLILSVAGMKITEVTDGGTYFKCCFDNDGGAITNPFVVDDLVMCQTFSGSSIKRYWRRVTSVGSDYFNLSKNDCEAGSAEPAAGDEIVQFGNRTDPSRQSAMILCAVGADAPYIDQYAGINSFILSGKLISREGNLSGIVDEALGQLSGSGLYAKNAYLRGKLALSSGKTVENALGEIDTKTDTAQSTGESAQQAALAASAEISTTKTELTKVTSDVKLLADAQSGFSVSVSEVWEKADAAQSAVDNLQIGGVNIFDNTQHPDLSDSSIWNLTAISGVYGEIASFTAIKITGQWARLWQVRDDFKAGQEYTFSCYVKRDSTLESNETRMNIFKNGGDIQILKCTLDGLNVGTGGINGATGISISPDKFQYLTFTFKSLVDTDGSYIRIEFYTEEYQTNNPCGVVYGYMMEKGNKATAWKQSFFDQQAQTEAVAQAKADLAKTQANAYADGIVTEAEQNAIDEAQKRLNALQIGGVNLLDRSEEVGTFSISNTTPLPYLGGILLENLVLANSYIISFDARIIDVPVYLYAEFHGGPGESVLIDSSTWKRYGIISRFNTVGSSFFIWLLNIGAIEMRKIKIESGNKFTEWTPSLADQQAQYDTAMLESEKKSLGQSWSSGKMLYDDPTFKTGINNIVEYSWNGNVIIDRIVKLLDSPVNAENNIEIKNIGTAEPGLGGFTFNTMSRPNAVFICRFLAKIPIDYEIIFASNAMGNNANHFWATENKGTGNWKEYIYVVKCGHSGDFSTTNFYFLQGALGTPEFPVVWYLAYASVFDVTDGMSMAKQEVDKGITVVKTELQASIDQKADSITLTSFRNDYTANNVLLNQQIGTLQTGYNSISGTISSLDNRLGTVETAGFIAKKDFVSIFAEKKEELGNSIISSINVAPGVVKIDAARIEITGATVFRDLTNNQTFNIFSSGGFALNLNNTFRVTTAGKLYATDVEITGKIIATSGEFTGKIRSNGAGNIIEINPTDRTFKLINGDQSSITQFYFQDGSILLTMDSSLGQRSIYSVDSISFSYLGQSVSIGAGTVAFQNVPIFFRGLQKITNLNGWDRVLVNLTTGRIAYG